MALPCLRIILELNKPFFAKISVHWDPLGGSEELWNFLFSKNIEK